MKTFTKVSLVVAGVAVVATGLFAAQHAAKAGFDREALRDRPVLRALLRRQSIRKHVARKLDLSADQITQLKSAREEVRDAIKAIRADSSLTVDQKKAKARELLQTKRTELRGALTPEQKEKVGEMRQKLRQRLGK
jgi:Spy/CpxP family protein refolding chaperone